MPGGNTRTVLHYSPFPLTITAGEGCRLRDLDGHGYTDFLGEYTAGLYGHSNPVIQAAIKKVVDDGMTVIVTGRENVKGTFKGAPGEYSLRFTNVYGRRHKTWQLLTHHVTQIAK